MTVIETSQVRLGLQEEDPVSNGGTEAGMDDKDLYSDDETVTVAPTKPAARPPAKRQMKGATPANQVAAGRVSKRAKK